jgi:uncharacterized membrane protein YdcZ (DUF606 family)/dienelactone hydrolase
MPTFLSGGKPIRITQHEPATASPHPAILLVHGAGGNVSFWSDRIAPEITQRNLALYGVQYFDRTGTVRADPATIQDGFHFPEWLSTIADALAYIRARPGVDGRRIALLGISLGAFLALTLATDPSANIRAIVEISGGLPDPYVVGATAAFPPTLILHGGADNIVPVASAHALDQLLNRLKVPHEAHIFPNQGHWFDMPTQLQILVATGSFLSEHFLARSRDEHSGEQSRARRPDASTRRIQPAEAQMTFFILLIAIAAGAANPFQSGTNAELNKQIGASLWAGAAVYASGLLGVLLLQLFFRQALPGAAKLAVVPAWAWLGGLISIGSTIAGLTLAQRLGAGIFTAVSVTAAIATSIALDHFGLIGFRQHTASPARIAGCALMIAGLWIVSRT